MSSSAGSEEAGTGTPDFGAIDRATPDPAKVVPDAKGFKEERDFHKEVTTEVHRLVIWSLRFGAIILGALLFVRFWHLGAPYCWRWLSEAEIQSMDKMLFSSAFGGFVLAYLKDAILKGSSK